MVLKVALGSKGKTLECAEDRKERRALVHMCMFEFYAAILQLFFQFASAT